MSIKIPSKVLEGLEAVRRSGVTNMLDYLAVIDLCRYSGYDAAAGWMEANKRLYSRGLFEGFESEE